MSEEKKPDETLTSNPLDQSDSPIMGGSKILSLDQAIGKSPTSIEKRTRLPQEESLQGLLRKIGERLQREMPQLSDSVFAGTFAVHVFKDKNTMDAKVLCQSTSLGHIPDALALLMLKELGIHVADRYGIKKPRKRGEYGPTFKES